VTKNRARILCVDDEPRILEGLSLNLGRRYEVLTATSGPDAIRLLEADRGIAVLMSDMRMPGMDGVAVLAKARQLAPDAVRMLLTGQADLDSALAAVNDGQIFRFLTKPCPPASLLAAVDAAAEQHRLITAERVLLEETLRGSVQALTEVLALTSPTAFGRGARIKKLVVDLAGALREQNIWAVAVAAMVLQLGAIAVPPEVVERAYFGDTLSEEEQKMLARVPHVTESLLAHIPRLETVREILANQALPRKKEGTRSERTSTERAAEILRVAVDLDALEGRGDAIEVAIATMQSRTGKYDPEVLAALSSVVHAAPSHVVRELPVSSLRTGMVLADDLKLVTGALLAARGSEITASFVERMRNFRPRSVKEPVRVLVAALPD
jgi:response regulator RpfG family c-di-GMP phosphodiesterase